MTAPETTQIVAITDVSMPRIEISPMRDPEDATAFRTLNEEWITCHFTLEEKDRLTLGDPESTIRRTWGTQVLMAIPEGKPVGCVALIPTQDGSFELSRMAVSPALQSRRIGRRLIMKPIN